MTALDANDIARRDGVEGLRDIFDATAVEISHREPPRPLMRELPPPQPFPADALGEVLAPAARAIQDRVQTPLAISGQSVLAMATLAVQAHADLELPTGQLKPVANYFVTVAATGDRKSACDTEAGWPVRQYEKALRERRDLELPSFLNDLEAWQMARDAAKKKAKGDRNSIRAALDALGPKPEPPLEPLLTCPEPTFEGLCKLFAVGQPSLGLFAAEGGQFIGGHGMSQDNKLKTAAGLSELWDGTAIRRVRSGDGVTILPGRRLSMHLMAQPGVADMLFRDSLLADQGLLSRLLVTAPASTAGTRLWHREQPTTACDLKRYGSRILDILNTPFPLVRNNRNELEPRPLPLEQKARRLWIEFADRVELAIAPGGQFEAVKGLANKLPEHAARLAAVLTLVRDLQSATIHANEMQSGIILAQHYAAEALRLFGASQANPDLILAKRLLDWLHNSWPEPVVSLPDIYQRGLNAIANKATAGKLVAILEDHGWLERIKGGAVVSGQRRRDVWCVASSA